MPRSKWFRSGEVKSPPHRPPGVTRFQICPSHVQSSIGVVPAGWPPTRKSTASEAGFPERVAM